MSNASLHPRRGLLVFLGIACGLGVSNIYFNQPLLLDISRTFGVSADAMGLVASATQIGYALGLFLFVPLADVVERRGLMAKLFAGVAISHLIAAVAPSLAVLAVASLGIGLTAAVTHTMVPIAPDFASDQDRGRAIGTVMTGLFSGILLARTFSGTLAHFLNWRAVFAIAALLNAAFIPLLLAWVPRLPPRERLSYTGALRSLWAFFRDQPLLREAGLLSAFVFGAFSTLWTTLAFLLGSSHYGLGAATAGSFGILGLAGVMIASVAGRVSDRRGSRFVITCSLGLLALAWAVFGLFGFHLAGLILGVVLLDLGTQANQIANQTRIFGLAPGARARVNTIYMTFFFVGGSLSSILATYAWAHFEWPGVSLLGLAFVALAALRHATGRRSNASDSPQEAR
jgi:predicted MFS family arabinose efflux permease